MSKTTTTESTEDTAVEEPAQAAPERVETFSADYVAKLRAEAAEARVRAKVADTANAHLLAAFAETDGRLRDVEALSYSDDLLGDDGLVDRGKVSAAIDDLLTRKPFLQRPKPAPLPMGVQADAPAQASWMAVLRGEVR